MPNSYNPETAITQRRRYEYGLDGQGALGERPSQGLFLAVATCATLLEARGWTIDRYGPGHRHEGHIRQILSPHGITYWTIQEAITVALELEAEALERNADEYGSGEPIEERLPSYGKEELHRLGHGDIADLARNLLPELAGLAATQEMQALEQDHLEQADARIG